MRLITALVCTLLIYPLLAQHDRQCGYAQYRAIAAGNDTWRTKVDALEKHYNEETRLQTRQVQNINYTIPITIHVLHEGGSENISYEQILQGLQWLNEALGNQREWHNDLGTDTGIELCLVQRDPEDHLTDGIDRISTIHTDMREPGSFRYLYDVVEWPEQDYLNIFLVKNPCLYGNCNIVGYGGIGAGIVVNAELWGSSLQDMAGIVHELGHTLGLYHTFHGGCTNDDCLTDGDKVCDTPPDNRRWEHCSIPADNSCTTDSDDDSPHNPLRAASLGGAGDQVDLYTNYMDYNWAGCREHFTTGQAARMHFWLDTYYAPLQQSKACLPPCDNTVSAGFAPLPDSIVAGSTVTVSNTSTNADSYLWSVNGSPISTDSEPSLLFDQIGRQTIELQAITTDSLCESAVHEQTVVVFCDIEPCINYNLDDNYLHYSSCSTLSNDSLSWTIETTTVLHSNRESEGRYFINDLPFVRLCQTRTSQYCSQQKCVDITALNDGSELCGNGMDDDNDGLIDLFDPDCPCDDQAYQAICPRECQDTYDSSAFEMQVKWQVYAGNRGSYQIPVVGNIDDDDAVEVVLEKTTGTNWRRNRFRKFSDSIIIIEGSSGRSQASFFYDSLSSTTPLSIINSNDNVIVLANHFYEFSELDIASSVTSQLVFSIDPSQQNSRFVVGDLNEDGRIELVSNSTIVDFESKKVIINYEEGMGGCGQPLNIDQCITANQVIADLLPTPGLEIAAGFKVYEVSIINTSDTSGNQLIIHQADSIVKDGYTAVADFDLDGKLDVVSSSGDKSTSGGGIFVWNPRTRAVVASAPPGPGQLQGFNGGVPTVGDLDGDCVPEIVISFSEELHIYKYLGLPELHLAQTIPTTDTSGFTGVTLFDFDQDGTLELVYRDETTIRIIDGITGNTLGSYPVASGTGSEYPVIADVDRDGQAEILIMGDEGSDTINYLYCFESAGEPWAPARSVWNQYNYNPLYVNDDLTIPRYPQNPAQPLQGWEDCAEESCPTPYNNFMVQATYRTQAGCQVWPSQEVDLQVTATSRCVGDSVEVCLIAIGADSVTLRQGIPIACYPALPQTDQLIDTVRITDDTTCMMLPSDIGYDSIAIVINDHGIVYPPSLPNTDIDECDYTNNTYTLDLRGPDYAIEVLDVVCTGDSISFVLEVSNQGVWTSDSCIGGACYVNDPRDWRPAGPGLPIDTWDPLELTSYCWPTTSSGTYRQIDTVYRSIAWHSGLDTMYWTINDPGEPAPLIVPIYEDCDPTNNVDVAIYDFSSPQLEQGPDIEICGSGVAVLSAGPDFESYLWSDLSTDSVYTAYLEGWHRVTVTDACGREQRDSVWLTYDPSSQVTIEAIERICAGSPVVLRYSQAITPDSVRWYPSSNVECPTCDETRLVSDTSITLTLTTYYDDCIAIDTHQIEVSESFSETIEETACDSFLHNSMWLTATGLYGDTLQSILGCDSIAWLDLTIVETTPVELSISACDTFTWAATGVTYTQTGQYAYQMTNAVGCDSIITLLLDLSASSMGEVTISDCDSVIYDGITYFTDQSLTEWSSNAAGCDSTTVISIDVISAASPTVVRVTGCDSVVVDGTAYLTDQTIEQTFASAVGCDSLVQTEVVISSSVLQSITETACDSLIYDGEVLRESGSYDFAFTTVDGCDSTVTVDLIIAGSITEEEATACDTFLWAVNGSSYAETGIYQHSYIDASGCDSIHQLELTIQSIYEATDVIQACDTYVWERSGETLAVSGNYDYAVMSIDGECDSVFYLDLTISESYIDTLLIDTVDAYTWLVTGEIYRQAGLYAEPFVTIDGCDSTLVLDLTIRNEQMVTNYTWPNIFNPSNQANAAFTIYGDKAIASIQQLSVYDRWGNRVWHGTDLAPGDPSEGWDGTALGQPVAQGVYIWIAELELRSGTVVVEMGDVAVIR